MVLLILLRQPKKKEKRYCRIIPTPWGLSQTIIQHCQPMARFVYVMIYWIQLFFFLLQQIYWVSDRSWQDSVWQGADTHVWDEAENCCLPASLGYLLPLRQNLSCTLINIKCNYVKTYSQQPFVIVIQIKEAHVYSHLFSYYSFEKAWLNNN